MNREEFLKQKISEKGKNLKTIAAEIDVPYSTLRDMQVNIGSARVDNVIKLCQYLDITVDELNASSSAEFKVTELEKRVIIAYRNNPDMRASVNKLLDIKEQPTMIKSFRAASSSDNHEPEIVEMEDLSKYPESDIDGI